MRSIHRIKREMNTLASWVGPTQAVLMKLAQMADEAARCVLCVCLNPFKYECDEGSN